MVTITKRAFAALATASLLPLAFGGFDAAFAKDKVKIAFVGPLTGALSPHGIGGRNSAELAVKLMNADPNTKYDYELVVLDDECKPNIGVQVVTKIASDRSIVAAVPHYCSATAIATVDIFNRFKLPMVVWAAVLPEITYANKFPEVHRVSGILIGQNRIGAEFMKARGYKKFVSFVDSTDYGKSMNKYFTQFTLENGNDILGTFSVPPDQQDLSAELTKIKELNPEVIYFGGLTPLGARLRTQMAKFGINAQFEGNSGIMGDAFINAAGPELTEGTVTFFDSPPITKMPGGKMFTNAYKAAGYSEPPEAYGPFAFIATNLVMETIEKVGPDRAKITEDLGNVKDRPSVVGPITFDDHGQNITPLTTKYVVQDGKWVVWEDSEYAAGKRKLKNLP
ncbi:branched-chain amino acid ABC transporter substrate-binding protein [Bradyrhizobium sp. KBS0727]|uniref:branched-chain amino acid ABC transporter substrate-binding protein n=1 Tax=unclassified Bradyrhizobium TaxID=2631580 RepID=UPI00110F5D8F|nr:MULTISPECIES: branched-chain amino acid ABC transporter substrate-binding protein [unclassified Bradyrhizobium]QDW37235.1 branched-chain amino acid ABC transporter substrate-binding protein [Bradyrhizobium sp. KBS0725]QDW43837.1 branched-chain amino acid ABC transporter substrate-binding protein [Bradyrhizobium sp. KBS0727]